MELLIGRALNQVITLALSHLSDTSERTRAIPRLISSTMIYLSLIIGGISLSACEAPAPPSSAFAPIDSNAGEEVVEGSSDAGDERRELTYQETLDGFWAHYSQVSTCVDIGSSLEQLNRTLYRVKLIQQSHGGMTEEWEACEVDLTPVIGVRARVPEALRKSIYPITTKAGQVVGAPPDQRYVSGPLVELWGVVMDEPTLDPMPVDEEDERIEDTDEDGHAGATLQIGDTCEAFMAQRGQAIFTGVLTAPDVVEGDALSVTEQFIIDASSPLCKTAYQTRSHPRRSSFKRVRIDGRGGSLDLDLDGDGEVTCAELLMGRDSLFEQYFEVQEVDDVSCRL